MTPKNQRIIDLVLQRIHARISELTQACEPVSKKPPAEPTIEQRFIFLLSILTDAYPLLIALFTGNAPLRFYYGHPLPSQVLLQGLWYLLPSLLFIGLVCGVIAGLLIGGGLACGRHYILRFLLWRSKVIPFTYHCEDKKNVESATLLSPCLLPPPLLAILPNDGLKRFCSQFCSQCCILSGGGS